MKYVALGDSVTKDRAGVITYFNLLTAEQTDTPFTTIVNNGIGGWKTSDLLTNIQAKVINEAAQVYSIMLGTNDHYWDVDASGPRVSVVDFETHYRSIISAILAINHGTSFNGGRPLIVLMASNFVQTTEP